VVGQGGVVIIDFEKDFVAVNFKRAEVGGLRLLLRKVTVEPHSTGRKSLL
jgi:hypothetical protein